MFLWNQTCCWASYRHSCTRYSISYQALQSSQRLVKPRGTTKPLQILSGIKHTHTISSVYLLPSFIPMRYYIEFQAALKKRSRIYLLETYDIPDKGIEDAQVISYQKLKSLVLSLKKEISTDIAIHKSNVLPRFL